MFKLLLRSIFIKKRSLDEQPEKSFSEIFREMMELDTKPKLGFAFIHPIEAYSYDLRKGRKVITDKGIGSIVQFLQSEYYLNIYLDKWKYVISRHPNNVFIIVVLCEDNTFKPLTFHDWKYIQSKLIDKPTAFPIEYRYTTHGNCCLTDKFKTACQQSNS